MTGVFLSTVDYVRFFFFPSAFASSMYVPSLENFGEEGVEDAVGQFVQLCQKNSIQHLVHKDLYEFSISQLTKETRFADLMIIGSETFCKRHIAYRREEYLKHALHSTECPVTIIPEKFKFPSHIILAYDGSASSVFAIKQFAGLLPELCNMKTILVYAGESEENIPDQVLIEELATRHFKDLTITKHISDHKNHMTAWFQKYKNPLIVCGSFGRSGFSELFSRSFIIDVIKDHQTPVFIAHQ